MTEQNLTEAERYRLANPVIEEPDADAEEVDLTDREPKDVNIIVDSSGRVENVFDPDDPDFAAGGDEDPR
jgi:hypothetical protein